MVNSIIDLFEIQYSGVLANVGGLLGLFSGISFLSFLEIFYFATLRLWGNVQKKRREEKEQGEEMENMTRGKFDD